MSKKTVIIGATPDTSRYAYLAAEKLKNHSHPIVLIGTRKGAVLGEEILDLNQMPKIENVDTVTMYINPTRQKQWQSYILSLKPKRIIFNPGTENRAFQIQLEKAGIETLNACTLVMLSSNQY